MEGVIKFDFRNISNDVYDNDLVRELIDLRNQLNKLSLVAAYDDGLGYGNVSFRENDCFYITASQTGHLNSLEPENIVKILKTDPIDMLIEYSGNSKPSSESVSHYMIYNSNPKIDLIVHFHNFELWEKLSHDKTIISVTGEYGSKELAENLSKAVMAKNSGVIYMKDHEEGVIIFGSKSDVVRLFKRFCNVELR
ncbi:MAG: class II aldolase/adducin family protein [Candidatus Delongbacteria bacterium]|nr:class II aldolase/adducin family protein [Candidatus Delongbacteria bacterium]MBN2836228.1 class II aldolase/adducin family protein [Candidatus Delongbacteria bacterium]